MSENNNNYQSYFKESDNFQYIDILQNILEAALLQRFYLGNILLVISSSLYFDLGVMLNAMCIRQEFAITNHKSAVKGDVL